MKLIFSFSVHPSVFSCSPIFSNVSFLLVGSSSCSTSMTTHQELSCLINQLIAFFVLIRPHFCLSATLLNFYSKTLHVILLEKWKGYFENCIYLLSTDNFQIHHQCAVYTTQWWPRVCTSPHSPLKGFTIHLHTT